MTPLSARTFGTYTFLASVIRLYAAYDITNPVMFQLALWTFVVAFVHFYSEWFIFGTTKFGEGLAAPALVSVGGLLWMLWQWGEYVAGRNV